MMSAQQINQSLATDDLAALERNQPLFCGVERHVIAGQLGDLAREDMAIGFPRRQFLLPRKA